MDLSSSLDGNVLDGKSPAFFYVRLENSIVLVYSRCSTYAHEMGK